MSPTAQTEAADQGSARDHEHSASGPMSALLPSQVLAKAADLIEPEGAWTQDVWRNDTRTCFCAEGAIAQAAGIEPARAGAHDSSRYLETAVGIGRWEVPTWNDAPGRTQAEVVAALRKASALAKESGQ